MAMMEKAFKNNELEIELTSYIDTKQNIWFKRKDVAKILDILIQTKLWEKIFLKNTKKAIPTARRVRWEIGFLYQNQGFIN